MTHIHIQCLHYFKLTHILFSFVVVYFNCFIKSKLCICFSCSSRHNNIFKDVYREVGILEVFVGCLVKYNGFLQKHINVESDPYDVELTNENDIENGKTIQN